MYILSVVPISQKVLKDELSYFSIKDVALGTLVEVPLRKKTVVALVVASHSASQMKSLLRNSDYQIRNIHKVLDKEIFTPSFLKMVKDVSEAYATDIGSVIHMLTPKTLIQDLVSVKKQNNESEITHGFECLVVQKPIQERIAYYKMKAREALSHKQSISIICSTVHEAEELYEHISKGIEKKCYLLHGKMTAKKITKISQEVNNAQEAVVTVGTVSTLILNPLSLSLYIIHNSNSPYYQRTVATPFLDLKDLVRRKAQYDNIPCTYADTMLGISTIHALEEKKFLATEAMSQRIFNVQKLHVLKYSEAGISEEQRIAELKHLQNGFHPLHVKSYECIQKAVKEQKKVFVYTPKKGMAPQMVCKECGNIAVSPKSNKPYSLFIQKNPQTQKKESVYVCVATGEKIPAFDVCQFCKGVSLVKMGIGTDSVAEQLQKDFPHAHVVVYTKDTMKTKKARQEFNSSMKNSTPVIVVGTSKAIFEIPEVDYSVVSSFAPLLSVMSYDNEEQVLYLLSKILEKTKTTCFLQDRKELLSHIDILSSGLYSTFFKEELSIRKEIGMPPYVSMITINIPIAKNTIKRSFYTYTKLFDSFDPSISVGPGTKKSEAIISIYISLSGSDWNFEVQNEDLKACIRGLDRKVVTTIRFQ